MNHLKLCGVALKPWGGTSPRVARFRRHPTKSDCGGRWVHVGKIRVGYWVVLGTDYVHN